MRRLFLIPFAVISLAAIFVSQGQSVEQLMASGAEALQSGAYAQAIARFGKVLAREPHNFEAQFNLSLAYLNSGRYQEALNELSKAAGLDQRNSEVWGAMGYAYERMGRREQAISSLSKAVNLDPNNIQARLNLASMYVTYDRLNEAITQYKQIVEIDGQNTTALLNLGKCLINKKQYAEAKLYLRQAATVDPATAGEARWEIGNLLWKQEDKLDEARKEYEAAIKSNPEVPVFYESLGRLLEAQKKNSEAIEVYKSALVHIDDVLKKDDIKRRIDHLEDPARGLSDSDERSAQRSGQSVEELKRQVRGQEQKEEVKTMDVGSLNIKTDLSDLTPDDGALDLKQEAKKRAQTK